MSRLSLAFLGTALAAAVTLVFIQVQVVPTGPAAAEPNPRSVHEVAPSGAIHEGH